MLIILGQLGDFIGYDSLWSNKVAQAIDLFFSRSQIDFSTLAAGVVTILLIVLLDHTRIKS